MPKNRQGGMKRKKRVHIEKESPFPIPIPTSTEETPAQWFYYTGYIEGSAVVVKHSGDMEFLYKMGFFGKGTLSRSQPNFNERSHRVHVELPQKGGQRKSVQAAVVNKRSYLVHRRYKALADGRMKEYNDIIHNEEQQQGFVDSSDEDSDDDEDDDSSSSSDFDTEKMLAFKLLNSSDSSSAVQVTVSEAQISGKVRSDLVSLLAEVSVLSNEQITSFLRVPEDMNHLTEKFKRMRAAEVKSLQQMYSAQFPGRHFKKGEVITLDEDDSAKSENENDNAVVISDSDDADGGSSENMKRGKNDSTEFLSGEKASVSSKKNLTEWASDDSNFWADDVPGDKKKTETLEQIQGTAFGAVKGGKEKNKTSSEQSQEPCKDDGVGDARISNVKVDDMKIDENGESKKRGSISVQSAENEGLVKASNDEKECPLKASNDEKECPLKASNDENEGPVKASNDENECSVKASNDENGEKGDIVHTEEVERSLLSFDENTDIEVPPSKTVVVNDVEDKVSFVNGSSKDKVNVDEKDDSKNTDSKLQSKSDDACSIDASQEVKTDGEESKVASSNSQVSSPDITSENNNEASVNDTLINTSEIVEFPNKHRDASLEDAPSKEPAETSSNNLKAASSTLSISAPDKEKEDKQLIFKAVNKDEDIQKDTVSNLDCPKLDDHKSNLTPVNVTTISVENSDTVMSSQDDGVTNIDSDNSNDSDDVICIESKSAEPKKLHNFLSQSAKKAASAIVTKSVTFMSSITEVPTFVSASVGFQTWGPILHFNFTGDASHLPTVMSVSHSADESTSSEEQSQSLNTVYERIFPPIKSLVPHANSTGAVIKQRVRQLPCLSSAYVKLSQRSHTSSRNGSTHARSQVPISRYSQSRLKPHSSVRHSSSSSSGQQRLLPGSSGKSFSTGTSPNSPILKLSQIASYMKSFQHTDRRVSSDNMDDDIKVLEIGTDHNGKSSETTSSLPAIVSKLEQLLNSSSSKDKPLFEINPEKPNVEIDNLLSEFHKFLNRHCQSLEISEVGESHVLKLIISKSKSISDLSSKSSNEVKGNISKFQAWLLEKRLEYLQRKTNRQHADIVDLAADSENKPDTSHSQRDADSEVIIDADVTDNFSGKFNAPVIRVGDDTSEIQTGDDGNKSSHSTTHSETNINEDQVQDKQSCLDETQKHSQKALETENRKRKFDRSDERSGESAKILKLNDDADKLLSIDNEEDENKISSCESKYETGLKEDDMLADGDSPLGKLEGELNNLADKSTKSIENTVESDIAKKGFIGTEKLNEKTSDSCELISGNKSTQLKSEPERDGNVDEDVSLSVTEESGCSEGSKLNSESVVKDKVTVETKYSTEVELTTNTSCPSLQQSAEDDLLLEDNIISQTASASSPASKSEHEKLNPVNENIESMDTTLDLKQEQHRCLKAVELPPPEGITCSEVGPKGNQDEKPLHNTEGTSGNLLAKDEIKHIESTSDCMDTSESVVAPLSTQLTKDLDSEKDIASSTCNTQSKPSDETTKNGVPQNAGASEVFQICIGSSSDEDGEPREKIKKQPYTYDGAHPYSARDDSEGELFVVPNTSDEDYYDTDKRDDKRQRQVWRSCTKKDPYPTEERLHLMLEEAFFLSFGLGCLKVLDPEMKKLNLTQMWQQFHVLKEQFIPHYVAYHYFRSKGWVPKSGLKFGCDLILYRDGPPFYHGSYSVVVTVVKDTTLLPVSRNGGISFDQRKLNWISLAGLNRITEHVAKELMLCYVIWPGDLTHEESLSPDCISRFQVKEVLVSRWVSSQERENKVEEEEEIP